MKQNQDQDPVSINFFYPITFLSFVRPIGISTRIQAKSLFISSSTPYTFPSMVPILRISRTVPPTRVRGAAFLEVRVHASSLGGDAACGIIDKHLLKQVQALVIKLLDERLRHVSLPFGE